MAVPKRAAEDAVLNITRADPTDPTTTQLHIPKGTVVGIDIPAVQFNRESAKMLSCIMLREYSARHWPNPQAFNPERFLGEWNRDALIAFSGGLRYAPSPPIPQYETHRFLRACIGRRFSETEGVAAITTLVSRYKVSLQDEEACRALPGETPDQRRLRIIQSDPLFTLTYAFTPSFQ